MNAYREFYRRNLPHWQPRNAILFVTFRLAGSLPRTVTTVLSSADQRARQGDLARLSAADSDEDASRDWFDSFERWDDALNRVSRGPDWLSDPRVAAVIAEAIHYRDGRKYDLWGYCIMPNHVHMIFSPLDDENGDPYPLYRILQSLKRHTALKANKILGRQGAFWQAESYDHVVRTVDDFNRILDYVLANPVKAGLVTDPAEWRWSYVHPSVGLPIRPTAKSILETLYPLHRTLTSDEMDEALRIVGEHMPAASNYTIETYAPGTPVWTWKVPERYVVRAAYLEDERGERILDFADNPLHLVSYSLPIDRWLTWDELEPHLFYSEERPDAIPWIFKYYQRDWGFCLSKTRFDQLDRALRYRAVIDVEFQTQPEDGFRVSTALLTPNSSPPNPLGELLISAHLCHPMQANDDLAGVVTAIEVAHRLAENPLPPASMDVRFWFGPETIGTIAYLAHHEDLIPRLKGGIFLEMTGNRSQIAVHRSRQGNHLLDRITDYVLRSIPHVTREFAAHPANDERVINGPGVDVPCISLNRWPYDEYHTSDDNPGIIHEEMLQEAADIAEQIVRVYASNYVPRRKFRGPVFLSGYGLWVDWRENWELNRAIEKIMFLFEGEHTIFDIAEEVNLDYWLVRDYVEKFRAQGLVEAEPVRWS